MNARTRWILIGALVVVVLIGLLCFVSRYGSGSEPDIGRVRFSGRNRTMLNTLGAGEIPSTAADPTAQSPSNVELSGPTMGSTWTVRVTNPPETAPESSLQSAIQSTLDTIEQQMSTWRENSELSRFNQALTTEWVSVSANMAAIAELARQVSDQTDGAFDVTVYPLVNLWGFGPRQTAGPSGTIPSNELIDQARKHVSFKLLEVRSNPIALRKVDPEITLDFSGIAKGYAAQQVGLQLESLGCMNYLVSVGGETCAKGLSPSHRAWHIGIETPTPGVRRILYTVELSDRCLSTSGDYRNFFDTGGHRYCHEIDPATGRPVQNPPASVTVIHPSGGYADAMATALMVLGPERGLALAERLKLPVLFIQRQDNQFVAKPSTAFAPMMITPLDP